MTRGICLFSFAFAILGGQATAQDLRPPSDEQAGVGHLVEKVPLTKPPSQVESYNKVRFTVEDRQSTAKRADMTGNNQYKRLMEKLASLEKQKGREGVRDQIEATKAKMKEMEQARIEQDGVGRTFAISGDAYYPDGTVLMVLARYWKLERAFAQVRLEVRDHKIVGEIGPIQRKIPRGKLAFECYFFLDKQKITVRNVMKEKKYFSCAPPCRYDKLGFNRTWLEMGGDAGQKKEEEAEKAQIKETLDALLAARTAGDKVFASTRKKQTDVKAAKAALDRLRLDVRTIQRTWREWLSTRAFPLFPLHCNRLESLASSIRSEGLLHAAVAGVEPEDDTRANSEKANYFYEYRQRATEVTKKASELKGFLSETGTLDRIWDELGESLKAKVKAREEAKKLEGSN